MEKVAVYASFKKQSRKSIDFFLRKIADWCLVNNYDYTIYFDLSNDCKIESMDNLDLTLYKKIIERFKNDKEERER